MWGTEAEFHGSQKKLKNAFSKVYFFKNSVYKSIDIIRCIYSWGSFSLFLFSFQSLGDVDGDGGGGGQSAALTTVAFVVYLDVDGVGHVTHTAILEFAAVTNSF